MAANNEDIKPAEARLDLRTRGVDAGVRRDVHLERGHGRRATYLQIEK
jgi:hypothetical protein